MHTIRSIAGGVAAAIAVASALLASGPPGALRAQAGQRCFQETTQCIEGAFREYWEQNGGLPVFGFPVTPARTEVNREDGQTYLTQWFERIRFEWHPEKPDEHKVLLGRIGDDRLRQQGVAWESRPRESGPRPGCLWFELTRYNVCDQANGLGFKTYWQTHGLLDPLLDADGRSLALFGLPLTELAPEVNAADGKTYLTQWFERARFEWHPEKPDEHKVLLGLLGNEVRAASGSTGPTTQPTARPTPSATPTPADSPLDDPNDPSGATDPGVGGVLGSGSVIPQDFVCPRLAPGDKQPHITTRPGSKSVATIFSVCFHNFSPGQAIDAEVMRSDGVVWKNQIPPDARFRTWEWIVLPGDPIGKYTVTATQGKLRATGSFIIVRPARPLVLVQPKEGPVGTTFHVYLAGFQPDQAVKLYLYRRETSKSFCGNKPPCYVFVTPLKPASVDEHGEGVYDLVSRRGDRPGGYLVSKGGVDDVPLRDQRSFELRPTSSVRPPQPPIMPTAPVVHR